MSAPRGQEVEYLSQGGRQRLPPKVLQPAFPVALGTNYYTAATSITSISEYFDCYNYVESVTTSNS